MFMQQKQNNTSTCTLPLSGHKYKSLTIWRWWCVCCERRKHCRQEQLFSLVKFNSLCQIFKTISLVECWLTLARYCSTWTWVNSSITQTPACNTTLAPVSYCEPTLRDQPRCISTNIHTLVTISKHPQDEVTDNKELKEKAPLQLQW